MSELMKARPWWVKTVYCRTTMTRSRRTRTRLKRTMKIRTRREVATRTWRP